MCCRMQRLKGLAAKTSSAEPPVTDNSNCATHDTEEDTHKDSHDVNEDLRNSCGPMPVVITDRNTEAQSSDQENGDIKIQENRTDSEEQNVPNRSGQEVVNSKELETDRRDPSPSTPLPVSNSIGSGLYIVGMHRKMVSIDCDCLGIILSFM